MEVWVLAAGAAALVALAVWLVARGPEPPEKARPDLAPPQTGSDDPPPAGGPASPAVPPQATAAHYEAARADLGAASGSFADRFTPATGDLSVGAVAEAAEEMRAERAHVHVRRKEADTVSTEAGSTGAIAPPAWADDGQTYDATTPPAPAATVLGVDGGTAAALVGAARTMWRFTRENLGTIVSAKLLVGVLGAVWLYRRWRQERERPVNRLRRRVRSVARDVAERLPDREAVMERLPAADAAAPAGGAGTALLVAALVAWRLLRGRKEGPELERAAQAAGASAPAEDARRRLARIGADVTQRLSPRAWKGQALNAAPPAVEEVRTRWGRIRFPSRLSRERVAEVADTAARGARGGASIARSRWAAGGQALASALAAGTAGYLLWRGRRGRREADVSYAGGSGDAFPNQ